MNASDLIRRLAPHRHPNHRPHLRPRLPSRHQMAYDHPDKKAYIVADKRY